MVRFYTNVLESAFGAKKKGSCKSKGFDSLVQPLRTLRTSSSIHGGNKGQQNNFKTLRLLFSRVAHAASEAFQRRAGLEATRSRRVHFGPLVDKSGETHHGHKFPSKLTSMEG